MIINSSQQKINEKKIPLCLYKLIALLVYQQIKFDFK